jgi:dsRNA-specific ribonuclease
VTNLNDRWDLPPLLPIRDHKIRERVFRHRSLMIVPKGRFEDPPEIADNLDNESLEFIGDSVMSFWLGLKIFQLYPLLRPGSLTVCVIFNVIINVFSLNNQPRTDYARRAFMARLAHPWKA